MALKSRILEAYLLLCYETTVTDITLQAVAKKAKVSFGSVHNHFAGSNPGLVESAIGFVGAEAQTYIEQHLESRSSGAAKNQLIEYIKGTFQWAHDKPAHSSYWLHYYYLTSVQSKFRQANGPFFVKARQRIEGLLYEAIGRKQYGPLQDIPALALKVHATLVGTLIIGMTDPTRRALDQQCALALSMIDAFIDQHGSKK